MEVGKKSWASLAPEVRLMILKALIQDGCCIARYATVCREWQTFVEQKTFGRLTLTLSRLTSFDVIVNQRRGYVKYLWLCIELQPYECLQCNDEETDSWHESNTEIIRTTIRKLLVVLSTWDASGSMMLDISVHSPSDSKHHFKSLRFGSDAIPESDDDDELSDMSDPRHGWIHGKLVSLPPEKSINRLFEDIEMTIDFWQDLPEVPAITGVLLRRQTRRRWEPKTLGNLFKLLPRLQEIYYESWREWSRLDQRWTDKSSRWLFESLVPNQLKKVVLFEDFNKEYISRFQGVYETLNAELSRKADFAVSRAVAEASLDLEHLSASFIVDARHFFQARQTDWVWNTLVSLVLTSDSQAPHGNHAEVSTILQSAAAAASKMPRLKSMEIWNEAKGWACVFRYQAPEGCKPARITWRGNWDLLIESNVVRAWEAVALSRGRAETKVINELLDADVVVKSHGDAIHHLKLLHQVVSPVSLWQIRRESNHYHTG